jgi:hypothetical protein
VALAFDARREPALDLLIAYEPAVAVDRGDELLRALHLSSGWSWASFLASFLASGCSGCGSSEAELGDDQHAVYLSSLVHVRP